MIRALPLLVLLTACTPSAEKPHDTGTTDTGTGETGTPADDTGETGDTGPEACQGDGDGRITFDEFVADPTLGIRARYTVNAAGSMVAVPSATAAWDFTGTTPSDVTWEIGIQAPADAWFADLFPEATYYVGLDAAEETYGIYRVDTAAERLLLLGMATATPHGGYLVYAEPVVVFEFPLTLDRTWDNVAVEAEGTWEGTTYPADYGAAGVVTLEHTYRFQVDATGTAEVPLGTFEALRVRLDQSLSAVNSWSGPFATETMITYFYVAECTGLVARIRSTEGERDPAFTQGSEYLRLGSAR